MSDTADHDAVDSPEPTHDANAAEANPDTDADEKQFPASYVEKLRAEAAAWRTKYKQATEATKTAAPSQAESEHDDQGDDAVARLADAEKRIEAAEQRARELEMREHVRAAAATHGANAEALLDSVSFLGRLSKIDAGENYAAHVAEAVKTAAEENPHYRAAGQAPPRSAGQHTGGIGGKAKPSSLTDAVAARYGRA